ncbi:hypothetical protein 20Sep418_00197 [Pseudomonas phage 20Sep418]|uniref:Uncharacterized protein n=6 Tax=Viruses TaxID=10239 RepID=A0A9E7IZT6_9CAUD|nr:hypothetical protein AU075_gp135 [Pseudomonas phage C11]YP_010762527.1 hypothetical protein QE325_gp050 [Pseudomonas phage pPA-3099-2aT.2]YP_010763513.1 hypothetical protein QE330_gp037 [Pseudomonas phage vB_Pae_Kat]YP_010763682.1 hypothetical protein QE331_gp154 [Pseudomonas phage 20Sep416]YP_010764762.1 hypothetical protein QE345_gp004 [Pseudomonas phage vB_PA45_GUMS]QAU05358.1 hypothetical protein S2_086 [Pseudomonas phage vB_PaeM_SCUT-S2]WFG37162.1 hypothetical protein 9081_00047 [Pseu
MDYWACADAVERAGCECCGSILPVEEIVNDGGMLVCCDCYFEMFCEEEEVNE